VEGWRWAGDLIIRPKPYLLPAKGTDQYWNYFRTCESDALVESHGDSSATNT
jgi:hypothetical protein